MGGYNCDWVFDYAKKKGFDGVFYNEKNKPVNIEIPVPTKDSISDNFNSLKNGRKILKIKILRIFNT